MDAHLFIPESSEGDKPMAEASAPQILTTALGNIALEYVDPERRVDVFKLMKPFIVSDLKKLPKEKCSLLIQEDLDKDLKPSYSKLSDRIFDYLKTMIKDIRSNHEVECALYRPETFTCALENFGGNLSFSEINAVIIQISTIQDGFKQILSIIRNAIEPNANYLNGVKSCIFVIGEYVCLNFDISTTNDGLMAFDAILAICEMRKASCSALLNINGKLPFRLQECPLNDVRFSLELSELLRIFALQLCDSKNYVKEILM